MLQIEEILAEIKKLAATNPMISVKDPVAAHEKRLGTLTPELASIYVLLDEVTKSKHKTEAQIHNMLALDKPEEDVEAMTMVVRALEDKREFLHTLLFRELRVHFNNYTDPGIGVRNGNAVVGWTRQPGKSKMPQELKDLLREALGDVETND